MSLVPAPMGDPPTRTADDQAAKLPNRAEFMGKLVTALENALTLRVTTVVCPFTLKNVSDFTARTEIEIPDGQAVECASTAINLLIGDVTETRTPKFVEDPGYAKMHDDALQLARGVLASNLAALKEAVVGLEKVLWRG